MKTVDHFGVHHKTKDGYQTVCKECHRTASIASSKKPNKIKEEKICSCCKISKPYVLFYKNKVTSDGFMNVCKNCFRIKYNSNKTLQTKSKPIIIKEDKKLQPSIGGHEVTSLGCLGCKKTLPISEFEDSVSGNFGKALYCKGCSKETTQTHTNFTVKDGFAVLKEKQPEANRIDEVVSDATLAHLVGSFIKTGVAIVKHIIKDLK